MFPDVDVLSFDVLKEIFLNKENLPYRQGQHFPSIEVSYSQFAHMTGITSDEKIRDRIGLGDFKTWFTDMSYPDKADLFQTLGVKVLRMYSNAQKMDAFQRTEDLDTQFIAGERNIATFVVVNDDAISFDSHVLFLLEFPLSTYDKPLADVYLDRAAVEKELAETADFADFFKNMLANSSHGATDIVD